MALALFAMSQISETVLKVSGSKIKKKNRLTRARMEAIIRCEDLLSEIAEKKRKGESTYSLRGPSHGLKKFELGSFFNLSKSTFCPNFYSQSLFVDQHQVCIL